jgi:hypothetical protein
MADKQFDEERCTKNLKKTNDLNGVILCLAQFDMNKFK